MLKVIAKLNDEPNQTIQEYDGKKLIAKLKKVFKGLHPIGECQKHIIKFDAIDIEELEFKTDVEYLMILLQNMILVLFLSSTDNTFNFKLTAKEMPHHHSGKETKVCLFCFFLLRLVKIP